jgi:DNA-binding MarR family transcriptional regulator
MRGECLATRVREAGRLLTKVYDEALRPVGLEMSQLPVLNALALFGEAGATVGALARALVMDRTTMTRNIRPLERAGLLRVARSPHDARAKIVLLTAAGERMVEAAFPLWERTTKRIGDTLGQAEVQGLTRRLGKLVAQGLSVSQARDTPRRPRT